MHICVSKEKLWPRWRRERAPPSRPEICCLDAGPAGRMCPDVKPGTRGTLGAFCDLVECGAAAPEECGHGSAGPALEAVEHGAAGSSVPRAWAR
ncbi:hypothetical protein NDU88_002232 [Pleurodeles waltl]|uniref:Uncharacterized protein n=1 Tax=Pleurodeles waltl TaxID=8319 RepID=A0AAV7WRQ7_PLEWA|nr:hypothetical protein NDU88_002232 [Pleurodeles waltl]